MVRITTGDQGEADPDGDRRVGPDDLVAFEAGVVADGYVGEVGRTWPAAPEATDPAVDRAASGRSAEMWAGACSTPADPAPPASDLLDAYGPPASRCRPMPVAHGLGLGFDPPVVSADLPATAAAETPRPGHGAGRHRLRVGRRGWARSSTARPS